MRTGRGSPKGGIDWAKALAKTSEEERWLVLVWTLKVLRDTGELPTRAQVKDMLARPESRPHRYRTSKRRRMKREE